MSQADVQSRRQRVRRHRLTPDRLCQRLGTWEDPVYLHFHLSKVL